MDSRTVWVVGYQKIDVRPWQVADEPPFGKVQIRVEASGVCAWDSAMFCGMNGPGDYPYPIGHEAAGRIVKVGPGVKNYKVGDKVFCAGDCLQQMSDYINVSEEWIARIPDDVEDYAPWVLEPTSCVVNLLYKANIPSGADVVLVGAGYMGLLTLQGLLTTTPFGSVTVFETRANCIELAKRYTCEVYNPLTDVGEAKVREIVAKGGADVVIDFTGAVPGFTLANRMLAMAGKFIMGAWHRHELTFNGTQWHEAGMEILNLSPPGNKHYSDNIIPASKLVQRGAFDPGLLVTHTAHIEDVDAVQELFMRSVDKADGYIKGVIYFN